MDPAPDIVPGLGGLEGAESLGELAHEKVKEILAKHKPAPLPEDVEKEIAGIL